MNRIGRLVMALGAVMIAAALFWALFAYMPALPAPVRLAMAGVVVVWIGLAVDWFATHSAKT